MDSAVKKSPADYHALRHFVASKTRLFVDIEGKHPRELKVGIDEETGPMYLGGHVWCYFTKDKITSYARGEGQTVYFRETEEGGNEREEIEEAIVVAKKREESEKREVEAKIDAYIKGIQDEARKGFAKRYGERCGGEEAAGRRFDELLQKKKRKKMGNDKDEKGQKKARK